MQQTEILDLEISGLTHDGRGLGRTGQGLVIFVQGGLPGQLVRLRLNKLKTNLAEGEVLEVLRSAPEERLAPCVHAGDCGGCAWQNLPYAEQLTWKRQLLADSLNRIGKLDLNPEQLPAVLPAAGGEWGYRNKMEFTFGQDPDGNPNLGLRRKASHSLVPITSCLLQTSRTMDIIRFVRDELPQLMAHDTDNLRFLVIREPLQGRGSPHIQCLAELISSPAGNGLSEAIFQLGKNLLAAGLISGFAHSLSLRPDAAYGQKTILRLGDTNLKEKIRLHGQAEQQEFNLGTGSFFQVNTGTAELLYDTALTFVENYIPPEHRRHAWDLYCGVGGLSLGLARLFKKVLGLDAESRAVALARQNAANFTNCRFEVQNAAKIGEYFRRFPCPDLLSLDPPRAGLAPTLIQALLRNRPKYLLYVSCNPATLGRDLALLAENYKILNLQGVDMFPQSQHLECIVLLRAKTK